MGLIKEEMYKDTIANLQLDVLVAFLLCIFELTKLAR